MDTYKILHVITSFFEHVILKQVVSSIPGSVGYISYPLFIEPTITGVPSGFNGYIWVDTKIVFKKNPNLFTLQYLSLSEDLQEWWAEQQTTQELTGLNKM